MWFGNETEQPAQIGARLVYMYVDTGASHIFVHEVHSQQCSVGYSPTLVLSSIHDCSRF